MISFKYDKEGDLLEIRFSENKVIESEYLEDVNIYDTGIELYGLSEEVHEYIKTVLDKIKDTDK